jgi:LAS superfamily LD-carboxypeptidase LdcB
MQGCTRTRCYVAVVLRILPSGCGQARPQRRPVALLGAFLTFAALVSVMLATPASSGTDPRTERDRVRGQKAATASQVDALRASDAEVDNALQSLDDNVRGQQAAYSDAQRASSEAENAAAEAREAERQKQADIERLRDRVARLAVETYVNPPSDDFLQSFEADNASEAIQRKALFQMRSGRDTDVLDELKAAERELKEIREQAEAASEEADRKRNEAQQRLGQVESARAQQAQFATQVQQRLDVKLSEAAALDATDTQLSAEISQQESALAARLRRTVPATAGGSGGPISLPSANIALANARGIVVAASIAAQTEALLDAAAGAGIALSGTGYRDSSSQIQLRMQNCGTSQYAIYQMSPDQCSPPTARPGASNHERGLAIDFSWNGSVIRSRSSPAFQWLAANAGRFGFANLPSEPWHWSVGGG